MQARNVGGFTLQFVRGVRTPTFVAETVAYFAELCAGCLTVYYSAVHLKTPVKKM
jgi:hypothetical protein